MKHKLLTVLLALVAALSLCFGLAACGEGSGNDGNGFVNVSGLWLELDEATQTYCVTGVDNRKKVETITIPAQYEGKAITSIRSMAFFGCSGLTSIVIPDGVTLIGVGAFYGTAYYDDATNWDESGVLYIGNHLIEAKDAISGTYAIRNGTRTIGDGAFAVCSELTNIEIPDNVTSIGQYAFENCSGLESVTIGNGVTSIGDGAFYDCSGLTRVDINDLAAWYKIDFEGFDSNPLSYAQHLYLDETEVKNLTIPVEITEIKDYAFYGCEGLTSIVIPGSVTSIGRYAFEGCSGLESVTIGNGVTEIGDHAFSGCSGLTCIEIPDSVTLIEFNVFTGCSGLERIIVAADNQKYRSVGDCLIEIDTNILISGCKNSKIPNGVTSIGGEAFDGCSGLTSIEIPDSVTLIGGGAFWGCSGLTSITIPDSVTSIGMYAFVGCSGLTNIEIPDSVTSIGEDAFHECSGLTDIQFKGTVKEWQAIEKGDDWDYYTDDYSVTCTDGTVDKKGNVTYFDN